MSFAIWSTPAYNLGEINEGDNITYNVSGSIARLGREAFYSSLSKENRKFYTRTFE